MSWELAIRDAEEEIRAAKEHIRKLSASIRFFKKKQKIGESFPATAERQQH